MKKFIFLLFIVWCCTGFAQTDTIRIRDVQFLVKISDTLSEYNRHDTILKFYRVENGKLKYLLRHTAYSYGEDCNNEFTDKGMYKVSGDSLIFTTEYFQKTGLDPLPSWRKQIYLVDKKGKLREIYDKSE